MMRIRAVKPSVCWMLWLVAALSALPAASLAGPALPAITLLPTVSVRESKIYLTDLVSPGSRSALPPASELERAVLGLSPDPGRIKVIEGRDLTLRLSDLGITADRYSIVIPERIRIEREGQVLSPANIEERVRTEFLPTLPWTGVTLDEIRIPESVILPVGSVELSYQYPPRTDLARPFYLNVNFRVDGATVKRLYVRTSLTVTDTVAVANREISSSDRLAASDVRWERRALSSTLRPPVSRADFFESRKTRFSIASGEVIMEDMFLVVPLIKRGDNVTLLYEDGKIRISAQGQSLAAGSRGDRIRVLNVSSHKELTAEVVDEKTVRVVF